MRRLFGTVRGKILVCCTALIWIALIFLGGYSYKIYAKSIRQKTCSQMDVVARSINIYCDQFFNEIDTISLVALQAPIVENACTLPYRDNQNFSVQYINTETDIFKYFDNLFTLKPLIEDVMLFGSSGMNYFYHPYKTWNSAVDSREETWYQEAVEANGRWIITPIRENRQLHYLLQAQMNEPAEVITFARLIRSASTFQPIGLLAIDIKADFIREIVTAADAGGVINILRQDGTPITRQQYLSDQEYLTVEHVSQNTGFTIQYSLPMSQLYEEIGAVGRMILFMGIGLCVVAFFIALLISSYITQPIQILRRQMNLVGEGRFEEIRASTSDVEIQQMYQAFNLMVERIQQLISEISQKEQQRIKHELYAIQVSINPHFIYNTLNCIRWAALLEKNQFIADIISSFIAVLRLSVSRRKEFITVREEMDFIRSYGDLMKLRYENVALEVEAEPEAENVKMLPFLIQPLVENSIFHGLAPLQGRPGKVSVSVRLQDGEVEAVIEDNGVGMDERQLEELKNREEPEHREEPSRESLMKIGVGSVRQRLDVYYKSEGRMRIRSRQGEGTRIELRWPAQQMEEMTDDAECDPGRG